MSDMLKTFREQGEPARMYCAHMDNDGCVLEDCEDHFCHLGEPECELVQAYCLGWNEALEALRGKQQPVYDRVAKLEAALRGLLVVFRSTDASSERMGALAHAALEYPRNEPQSRGRGEVTR